jgi:hypothetical protein
MEDFVGLEETSATTWNQKSVGSLTVPHIKQSVGRLGDCVKSALELEIESVDLSTHPSKLTSAHKSKSNKTNVRTAGHKWFDMRATEITPEVERDLKLLKLRQVLDPKRFYKKDDSLLGGRAKGADPGVFQIGTILDSPLDTGNSRITNKQRKRHIVDDLLADDDSRRYYKKKFMEVQKRQEVNQSKQYHAIKRRRLDTYKQLSKQHKSKK